jgi:hypothetical protein
MGYASRARSRRASNLLILLMTAGTAVFAQQSSDPVPSTAATASGDTRSGATQIAAGGKADDDLLAKTARLYYSTRAAGLDGFDCDVHPDWRTLFSTADNGAAVADNDTRLVTMTPVRIALHARMGGESTIDWKPPANPDKPADPDAATMLDRMHEATEQTLRGFLQFWTPFVDGSVVPENSTGLKITRSEADWTIHAQQNGTEVTEIFSKEMILQHFNVLTGGMSIKFDPAYQPTEKGLLVNRFDAHIEPAGQSSGPVQVMHVQVVYAPIDGVPIPSQLIVEVVGTGTFNMALDGCHTLRASK